MSVYECATDDQIVDLLRGGQGVFGIAIGHTATDVIEHLPSVPVDDTGTAEVDTPAGGVVDELAARRTGRRSA